MADNTPNAPPTPNAIVHHDYFSADPKATQAFFEKIFGWKFSSWDPSYALFEGPDGTSGGVGKPMEGQAPGNVNYVAVKSLAKTVKDARAAGAHVVVERQEVPGMGALAIFVVPGGVVQGIWESSPPR